MKNKKLTGVAVPLGALYTKDNNIIGYKYCNMGKMMANIKKGMDPKEAVDDAIGIYGRYNDAVKYIDPREE